MIASRVARLGVVRKGGRQVISVTIGSGLQRGLGGLLVIAMVAAATRGDSKEAAGTVGVATYLISVAFAIADLGTTSGVLRDFSASSPTRGEFRRVARLKVLLALGIGIVLSGATFAFWSREGALAVAAGSLAIPALALTSAATGKLVVDGEGERIGLAALMGFSAGCFPVVVWLAVGGPLATLLLALPAARLTESTALLLGCSFTPRLRRQPGRRFHWQWLQSCSSLAVVNILQTGYSRVAVLAPALVLLKAQQGDVAQGFTLFLTGTLLPGALGMATWPLVSRAVRRSNAEALRVTFAYSAIGILGVLPAAALLFTFPGTILHIIYGGSSPGLEAYMRWAALALFFQCPNALMFNMLIALDRGRMVAFAWASALAVATVLFVAGASGWGVAGAGAALFAAEFSLLLMFVVAIVPPDRRVAALVLAAIAAVAAGGLAPVLGRDFAFPDPSSGLVLLLALPVVVLVALRALNYDLLAPAALFTLVWTTALGIAQVPLYPSFSWSGEMWVLITVPPAAFAIAAALATGSSAQFVQRTGAAALAMHPPKLLIVLFVGLGLIGWARFFQQTGVPLLSGNIDTERFAHFSFPALVATRFGHVAIIASLFFALASKERRWQFFFLAVAAVAVIPTGLSGGRLYLVSSITSGGIAGLLIIGVSRRVIVVGAISGFAVLAVSTSLWFTRIDQQTQNPFKTYLDETLSQSRPDALQFTIPLQMAASASMHTLSDLVDTRAFEREPGTGLYSVRAFDRVVPARDIEQPAAREARFGQITSTYLGPSYADWGIPVTVVLSAAVGLIYGLMYRRMRRRPSLFWVLLYSYSAFWLIFSVFLAYWSQHGLWVVDIPLFGVIGYFATRPVRAGRYADVYPMGVPAEGAPASVPLLR